MTRLTKPEKVGAGLASGTVLLVGGSVAASSVLAGYPVLGGQAARYLAAGLLLFGWSRLRRERLLVPRAREWAWLAALSLVGLAGCSALVIEATRVSDPASVGVVIGASPLVIVIATALAAGRLARRVLAASAAVTAGAAAAQLGASGATWNAWGLLLSLGALCGVVGTTILAAPVLPRLGALTVTTYACLLAGAVLLTAGAGFHLVAGAPILSAPNPRQLAALAYLAVAVTAIAFIAWYGAMQRLGTQRTGLFNGLIPIASVVAVELVGTGSVTLLLVLGALAVLIGVMLGLTTDETGAANTMPSASPSDHGAPFNGLPAGKSGAPAAMLNVLSNTADRGSRGAIDHPDTHSRVRDCKNVGVTPEP
jgi:drug/metabolite transporter (DMT)-like permease